MKVVLVDDEKSALFILRENLKIFMPSIIISGEFDEPEEAVKQIPLLKPDAIFLDIGMPRLDGFEVMKLLPEITAKIILTTAHREYGPEAYRFSAFDYLTKPIDKADLLRVIQKLELELLQKKKQDALPTLRESLQVLKPSHEKLNVLPITTLDAIYLLPLAEIIRLEADGAYTTIYLVNQHKFVSSKHLGYNKDFLDSHFFQVHRSHIINLNFVNKYNKGEGGSVVLTDGTEIVVSRESKQELLERIFGK
ncbi:LytR/AlgR family response regulator transcription factor [Flavitalea antarctica]